MHGVILHVVLLVTFFLGVYALYEVFTLGVGFCSIVFEYNRALKTPRWRKQSISSPPLPSADGDGRKRMKYLVHLYPLRMVELGFGLLAVATLIVILLKANPFSSGDGATTNQSFQLFFWHLVLYSVFLGVEIAHEVEDKLVNPTWSTHPGMYHSVLDDMVRTQIRFTLIRLFLIILGVYCLCASLSLVCLVPQGFKMCITFILFFLSLVVSRIIVGLLLSGFARLLLIVILVVAGIPVACTTLLLRVLYRDQSAWESVTLRLLRSLLAFGFCVFCLLVNVLWSVSVVGGVHWVINQPGTWHWLYYLIGFLWAGSFQSLTEALYRPPNEGSTGQAGPEQPADGQTAGQRAFSPSAPAGVFTQKLCAYVGMGTYIVLALWPNLMTQWRTYLGPDWRVWVGLGIGAGLVLLFVSFVYLFSEDTPGVSDKAFSLDGEILALGSWNSISKGYRCSLGS